MLVLDLGQHLQVQAQNHEPNMEVELKDGPSEKRLPDSKATKRTKDTSLVKSDGSVKE